MTRINVIPVEELSDQHLIAEYHELPRVFKQKISVYDAPVGYCLGKGHCKWAKKHGAFLQDRYIALQREMAYRGFMVRFGSDFTAWTNHWNNYLPTNQDIDLNRQRIREKYEAKPNWYRWTKRARPAWL